MNLIEEIEAFRLRHELTKTVMAGEFGVIYQNYNNWIARSSLPKEHYEKAYEILGRDEFNKSRQSDEDQSFISKYRDLDDEGKKAISLMMDTLAAREARK